MERDKKRDQSTGPMEITIKKKGEDGHRVVSVRMSSELIEKLDAMAIQTNRSRNNLINELLTQAIEKAKIED